MAVADLMLVVLILFATGISIFVAYHIVTQFQTLTAAHLTEPSATQIVNIGVHSITVFDWGFLILTIGTGLAAVILAFRINTHPVFFFFSIILLALELLIIPQFSNAFESFINISPMSSIANTFPIVVRIMRNLPLIMFGFGAFIVIALYAKGRSYGE